MFYCLAKFFANSPVMLPFLSLSKKTNPQKSNHPNLYLVLELPDEGQTWRFVHEKHVRVFLRLLYIFDKHVRRLFAKHQTLSS